MCAHVRLARREESAYTGCKVNVSSFPRDMPHFLHFSVAACVIVVYGFSVNDVVFFKTLK